MTNVAKAAEACFQSFYTTSQLDQEHNLDAHKEIADQLARFQIWADNIGARHTSGNLSADYRLREVPEISQRIVELLDELRETLQDAAEILSGRQPNRELDNGKLLEVDPPSGEGDELSELCLAVGDTITSLMKVSMLIRKSGTDRYTKAAAAKAPRFLSDFDIRHVSDKYPKLLRNQVLLQRLGNAITQRRQFLRYSRDHASRVSAPAPQVTEPTLELQPVQPSMQMPKVAAAGMTTISDLTRPVSTPTKASTLQPELARQGLQQLDNGADAVSETTSFVSSRPPDNDSEGLRVASLTDFCNDGEPFECPYCRGFVQARRQRSWRKHVFADLRTYVCTFSNCGAGLFEDKISWARHELDVHRRIWTNGDSTFSSSRALESHLQTQHASLAPEIIQALTKASSQPVATVPAIDCPFCDEWEANLRVEAQRGQEPITDHQSIVVTVKNFHDHLGAHMEQLALFAIPPNSNGNNESASENAKSKADGDRGANKSREGALLEWQEKLDNPSQGSRHDLSSISPDTTSDIKDLSEVADTVPDLIQQSSKLRFKPKDVVYVASDKTSALKYTKAVISSYLEHGSYSVLEYTSGEAYEANQDKFILKTPLSAAELQRAAELVDANASYSLQPDVASVFAAVNRGDTEFVKLTFGHLTSNIIKDSRGDTVLHRAVRNGRTDMVACLLAPPISMNPNENNNAGDGPLYLAADLGEVEVMFNLIVHGADVNAPNAHGNLPLHAAITSKSIEAMRLLLSREALINVRGSIGLTPLLLAAFYYREEHVFRLLVNRGAKVRDTSPEGLTVLHILVKNVLNSSALLHFLLNHDIALGQIPDANGLTPLHYCVQIRGLHEVARVLLQYGADPHNDQFPQRLLKLEPLQDAVDLGESATSRIADTRVSSTDEVKPGQSCYEMLFTADRTDWLQGIYDLFRDAAGPPTMVMVDRHMWTKMDIYDRVYRANNLNDR